MSKQTAGIVLLSADNFYLREDGSLPARPSWDKGFLLHLVKGKKILCSVNTFCGLPPSMLGIVSGWTTDPTDDWDVNLGISTFRTNPPDIMYVVRTDKEVLHGKSFDMSFFDAYELLAGGSELTIYERVR